MFGVGDGFFHRPPGRSDLGLHAVIGNGVGSVSYTHLEALPRLADYTRVEAALSREMCIRDRLSSAPPPKDHFSGRARSASARSVSGQ